MQPDAITASAVRQALRAIRSARSLTASPLLHLAAVTEGLAAEHLSDTPASRAAILARRLNDLAWLELARLQGNAAAGGRPPPVLSVEAALAALRADFRARSTDREAWAVLHYHYFSSSRFTLREIAAALGLGYNTVRHRVERGHALFAERLREGERAAGAAIDPGRSVNLPRPLTRFIGRETELGAIRAFLAEHRLVTLTGRGGIGKSRLAIHLAQDLAADYPDGACFVEMAALADERQVPQAVLATLGLREAPGLSPTRVLTDFLAGRRLLLVVDNCEHLIGACSALVGALLRHGEGLQVLATSRETLFVDGGAVYPVPPMALPPEAMAGTAGSLIHYDAPRLFGVRAAAARPGFRLDDANAARVAGICARLDGIPLAIELAAALTRYLALDDLDARLVDRFALLKDGHHAAKKGHETLRAAMDWSYELLTEPERRLLQRLSVFRGGWTLEAAEAVCAGEGIDEREVLAFLAQLEAKSLIVVQVASGERRFRMLETVREYAKDRLADAGDEAERRDRHVDYFLKLAELAEPQLEGPKQGAWLAKLGAEQANWRSAFDRIIEKGSIAQGSELANRLYEYWMIRGEWQDALMITSALLELDDPPGTTVDRLRLLVGAASHAYMLNEHEIARPLLEEALALATILGHPPNKILNLMAVIAEQFDRDYVKARELYEHGLTLSRAEGNKRGESAILHNLGAMASQLGEHAEAARLIETGLAIDRELGNLHDVAFTLRTLGTSYWHQGDMQRARAYYEESLAICRALDAGPALAEALTGIGGTLIGEDDDRAVRAYEEALAILGTDGSAFNRFVPLNGLGEAQIGLGNHAVARQHIEESLSIAIAVEHLGFVNIALESLALLAMAQGEPERAARLVGAATARLDEAAGIRPMPPEDRPGDGKARRAASNAARVERILKYAADILGTDARDAAVAEGYAMAPDVAVAYALGEVT